MCMCEVCVRAGVRKRRAEKRSAARTHALAAMRAVELMCVIIVLFFFISAMSCTAQLAVRHVCQCITHTEMFDGATGERACGAFFEFLLDDGVCVRLPPTHTDTPARAGAHHCVWVLLLLSGYIVSASNARGTLSF